MAGWGVVGSRGTGRGGEGESGKTESITRNGMGLGGGRGKRDPNRMFGRVAGRPPPYMPPDVHMHFDRESDGIGGGCCAVLLGAAFCVRLG